MLNKIRDFMDTQVCMVILMEDAEQLKILMDTITSIGRKRCRHKLYVVDTITPYMMELRLPYNRYLAMMKGLQKRGLNLKMESEVGIFNRMVKDRA